MKDQTDLTIGNPTRVLLAFAIPFFIANLLQALYSAVDLLTIGWFCPGASATAAVGNGAQIMMIAYLFIIGLTTAETVIIGKYFGAKETASMRRFIGSSLVAFSLFTVVLTGLTFLLLPVLFRLLQTPADVLPEAQQYAAICTAGLVFVFGCNVLAGILRGVGNSFVPMVVIGCACLANVFLDILFIGYWNMGPAGAAWATVGSQALSVLLLFLYLRSKKDIFEFRFSNLKLDIQAVRKLLAIGLPLSIQSITIDLSFIIIFSLVNSFGVAASAAYGIGSRLCGLILLPAMSMSMALTPSVAQNLGAGKPERAFRFYWLGILYSTLIGIGLFIWVEFWPQTAFVIFTRDPDVIAAGSQYMRSFCYEILVLGFVFSSNGFLNGCGHTRFTMVCNVIPTFLVRVPFAWYVSQLPGATLYGLGFASPLASFVTVFIVLIYLSTGRWKINRI